MSNLNFYPDRRIGDIFRPQAPSSQVLQNRPVSDEPVSLKALTASVGPEGSSLKTNTTTVTSTRPRLNSINISSQKGASYYHNKSKQQQYSNTNDGVITVTQPGINIKFSKGSQSPRLSQSPKGGYRIDVLNQTQQQSSSSGASNSITNQQTQQQLQHIDHQSQQYQYRQYDSRNYDWDTSLAYVTRDSEQSDHINIYKASKYSMHAQSQISGSPGSPGSQSKVSGNYLVPDWNNDSLQEFNEIMGGTAFDQQYKNPKTLVDPEYDIEVNINSSETMFTSQSQSQDVTNNSDEVQPRTLQRQTSPSRLLPTKSNISSPVADTSYQGPPSKLNNKFNPFNQNLQTSNGDQSCHTNQTNSSVKSKYQMNQTNPCNLYASRLYQSPIISNRDNSGNTKTQGPTKWINDYLNGNSNDRYNSETNQNQGNTNGKSKTFGSYPKNRRGKSPQKSNKNKPDGADDLVQELLNSNRKKTVTGTRNSNSNTANLKKNLGTNILSEPNSNKQDMKFSTKLTDNQDRFKHDQNDISSSNSGPNYAKPVDRSRSNRNKSLNSNSPVPNIKFLNHNIPIISTTSLSQSPNRTPRGPMSATSPNRTPRLDTKSQIQDLSKTLKSTNMTNKIAQKAAVEVFNNKQDSRPSLDIKVKGINLSNVSNVTNTNSYTDSLSNGLNQNASLSPRFYDITSPREPLDRKSWITSPQIKSRNSRVQEAQTQSQAQIQAQKKNSTNTNINNYSPITSFKKVENKVSKFELDYISSAKTVDEFLSRAMKATNLVKNNSQTQQNNQILHYKEPTANTGTGPTERATESVRESEQKRLSSCSASSSENTATESTPVVNQTSSPRASSTNLNTINSNGNTNPNTNTNSNTNKMMASASESQSNSSNLSKSELPVASANSNTNSNSCVGCFGLQSEIDNSSQSQQSNSNSQSKQSQSQYTQSQFGSRSQEQTKRDHEKLLALQQEREEQQRQIDLLKSKSIQMGAKESPLLGPPKSPQSPRSNGSAKSRSPNSARQNEKNSTTNSNTNRSQQNSKKTQQSQSKTQRKKSSPKKSKSKTPRSRSPRLKVRDQDQDLDSAPARKAALLKHLQKITEAYNEAAKGLLTKIKAEKEKEAVKIFQAQKAETDELQKQEEPGVNNNYQSQTIIIKLPLVDEMEEVQEPEIIVKDVLESVEAQSTNNNSQQEVLALELEVPGEVEVPEPEESCINCFSGIQSFDSKKIETVAEEEHNDNDNTKNEPSRDSDIANITDADKVVEPNSSESQNLQINLKSEITEFENDFNSQLNQVEVQADNVETVPESKDINESESPACKLSATDSYTQIPTMTNQHQIILAEGTQGLVSNTNYNLNTILETVNESQSLTLSHEIGQNDDDNIPESASQKDIVETLSVESRSKKTENNEDSNYYIITDEDLKDIMDIKFDSEDKGNDNTVTLATAMSTATNLNLIQDDMQKLNDKISQLENENRLNLNMLKSYNMTNNVNTQTVNNNASAASLNTVTVNLSAAGVESDNNQQLSYKIEVQDSDLKPQQSQNLNSEPSATSVGLLPPSPIEPIENTIVSQDNPEPPKIPESPRPNSTSNPIFTPDDAKDVADSVATCTQTNPLTTAFIGDPIVIAQHKFSMSQQSMEHQTNLIMQAHADMMSRMIVQPYVNKVENEQAELLSQSLNKSQQGTSPTGPNRGIHVPPLNLDLNQNQNQNHHDSDLSNYNMDIEVLRDQNHTTGACVVVSPAGSRKSSPNNSPLTSPGNSPKGCGKSTSISDTLEKAAAAAMPTQESVTVTVVPQEPKNPFVVANNCSATGPSAVAAQTQTQAQSPKPIDSTTNVNTPRKQQLLKYKPHVWSPRGFNFDAYKTNSYSNKTLLNYNSPRLDIFNQGEQQSDNHKIINKTQDVSSCTESQSTTSPDITLQQHRLKMGGLYEGVKIAVTGLQSQQTVTQIQQTQSGVSVIENILNQNKPKTLTGIQPSIGAQQIMSTTASGTSGQAESGTGTTSNQVTPRIPKQQLSNQAQNLSSSVLNLHQMNLNPQMSQSNKLIMTNLVNTTPRFKMNLTQTVDDDIIVDKRLKAITHRESGVTIQMENKLNNNKPESDDVEISIDEQISDGPGAEAQVTNIQNTIDNLSGTTSPGRNTIYTNTNSDNIQIQVLLQDQVRRAESLFNDGADYMKSGKYNLALETYRQGIEVLNSVQKTQTAIAIHAESMNNNSNEASPELSNLSNEIGKVQNLKLTYGRIIEKLSKDLATNANGNTINVQSNNCSNSESQDSNVNNLLNTSSNSALSGSCSGDNTITNGNSNTSGNNNSSDSAVNQALLVTNVKATVPNLNLTPSLSKFPLAKPYLSNKLWANNPAFQGIVNVVQNEKSQTQNQTVTGTAPVTVSESEVAQEVVVDPKLIQVGKKNFMNRGTIASSSRSNSPNTNLKTTQTALSRSHGVNKFNVKTQSAISTTKAINSNINKPLVANILSTTPSFNRILNSSSKNNLNRHPLRSSSRSSRENLKNLDASDNTSTPRERISIKAPLPWQVGQMNKTQMSQSQSSQSPRILSSNTNIVTGPVLNSNTVSNSNSNSMNQNLLKNNSSANTSPRLLNQSSQSTSPRKPTRNFYKPKATSSSRSRSPNTSNTQLYQSELKLYKTITIPENSIGYGYQRMMGEYVKNATKCTIRQERFGSKEFDVFVQFVQCVMKNGRGVKEFHLITSSSIHFDQQKSLATFASDLKSKFNTTNLRISLEDPKHGPLGVPEIKFDNGWTIRIMNLTSSESSSDSQTGINYFVDKESDHSGAGSASGSASNIDSESRKCKSTRIDIFLETKQRVGSDTRGITSTNTSSLSLSGKKSPRELTPLNYSSPTSKRSPRNVTGSTSYVDYKEIRNKMMMGSSPKGNTNS